MPRSLGLKRKRNKHARAAIRAWIRRKAELMAKVHAQSQNRTSEIGRPFLTMEPNNKLPVLSERLAGKQETTSTKESFTHTNETIFVEAEPSFLVYYRDNLSLAQKDPLAEDTVQVKFEPKTEPVDCIAEDEVMIKEEFLMYDSVMTDYRIS